MTLQQSGSWFWLWLTLLFSSYVDASKCSKTDDFLILPGRSCGVTEAIKEIYDSPEDISENVTLNCAMILGKEKETWIEHLKEQAKPGKVGIESKLFFLEMMVLKSN